MYSCVCVYVCISYFIIFNSTKNKTNQIKSIFFLINYISLIIELSSYSFFESLGLTAVATAAAAAAAIAEAGFGKRIIFKPYSMTTSGSLDAGIQIQLAS